MNVRGIGIVFLSVFLSACGSTSNVDDKNKDIVNKTSAKPTKEAMHLPIASETSVFIDELITLDYSNIDQGYIMVKCNTEAHQRIKIQITCNDTTYTYDLNHHDAYEVYPITLGDGSYTIKWLENVEGTRYALIGSLDVEVTLQDQLLPFLFPNQYIDYNQQTKAVDKAFELIQDKQTELERVKAIYDYVTSNVRYDWDKVEAVQGKFVLPIIDETFTSNKGICFDYAALMSTMLRCLNIPTKLITGMVTDGYHAWVEVYIDNIGWITPHVYFDANTWTAMDPTFDAMDRGYEGNYESQNQY